MNTSLITQIKEDFYAEFQIEPLLAFAPGRINIIGEHTDYNEGYVFPAAINLGIGVAIQKSTDASCHIISKDMNESFSFNTDETLTPIPNGGWKNYILGIIIELKKAGVELLSFNMVFRGNIPIGSGLSSSAAFENAFLTALNALQNLNLDKMQMVLIGQSAEHNAVGVKCGIMDQYSSMFGKKEQGILLDCKTISSTFIPINLEDYEILLINSNVKHSLAESAYNDRREACERVSEHFKITSLRHLTIETLIASKGQISSDDFNKALYILEENNRVKAAVKALQNKDLSTLGTLLFKSHKGMKDLYKITCAEIDFLVDEANKNDDVIGARMMGGGFGGCTINIVKKNKSKVFFESLLQKFYTKFGIKCTSIPIKISGGARLINTNTTNEIPTRTISQKA